MKILSNTDTRCHRFLRRFRADDDGGILYVSLCFLILILMMGGLAVDLMRYETTRAQLQGTLDRAALAAADLDQTLPPTQVVEDYFEKAGMIDFLDGSTVDQGINFRRVSATASAEMPFFFFDVFNAVLAPDDWIPTSFTVGGNSTAEERVTDVEVSLVLDMSSSMLVNNRIENLRPAAREFVSTVLSNNTDAPQGLITVSIIPYSAVVNVGDEIAPMLTNLNRTHDYSTCPLFQTSMFASTTLNLDASYEQVAHFDPYWHYDALDEVPIKYPFCPGGNHNAIVVHSTDEGDLHDKIDALVPFGNTSIDMGMKWAVGLLDPSTQRIVTSLAGVNDTGVPASAAGRPREFGAPDVLKIVVLMTDGQNTNQYDLNEPYKSGMSPVWFARPNLSDDISALSASVTSVQYDGASTPSRYDDWFHWNINNIAYQYPYGFSSRNEYLNAQINENPEIIQSPDLQISGIHYSNNVLHASWQDLYARNVYWRPSSDYLYWAYAYGRLAYSDYESARYPINYYVTNGTQSDARLSSICAAARDEGVIIYTVAFEAPPEGQTALLDCASSPTHYFDVNGTDISSAFAAIASDIRALKLTD